MRILIVEDNLVLADKIAAALRQTDHAVDLVHDGEDALRLVLQETFDLLILDLSLPGLDGIEILKTVRARKINLPVMILTARGNLDERVAGLDAGADDYMVKPFELSELEARARALLRRNIGQRNPAITVGKLTFNSVDRSVTIDGQPVSLTPRERGVLEILLLNVSQVISKEKIALHLFGFDDEASVKSIELYISRLRKKIASGDVEVRTIRGLGYMIDE
ncbi:DNA-binding response OmpR family regulator [Thalassospira sp. MBR-102]|jgi:two-component system OmpR family response regulator/two-component system response regulator TctD|uniref:Transcriptional regulator n=2 Tax=Thalassospira TaxID=168934 RepID=A0A367WBG7_9PROT|nr:MULTISPECIES: response regulator transcription factor [Thalassospira]MBR9780170.1 response regulator transcription factor [Rhodospirillales bacterium]KZB55884.1 two-component system response regulator [Thalassospira xiamenensis]KZB68983.1 two-component system response regulator [Thalassospira lucentensis]KZD04709.1 two-component system response regulator [Thalassospira xiamenensis]KZD05301.1 two-component system response regulator [Thalassospira xiamenensis]|tara:strand:- start:527 stop:1189 length:663 start_codon:yes stop_codon:yes gene_type:complete